MNTKIKINNIIYVMAFLLVFFDLPYVPYFSYIKYVCIVICGLFIISKYKYIFIKENQTANIFLFIFFSGVVIISYIDKSIVTGRNTFLASIVFSISMVEFYLIMQYVGIRNNIPKLIYLYKQIVYILVVITDVLVFTMGPVGSDYFIGTKFSVCYLHMMAITLAEVDAKYSEKKRKISYHIFLLIISFLISIKVSCATGSVGIFIYAILFLNKNLFYKRFTKSNIVMISMFASCSFMFFYNYILSNYFVQYLITNILNRKITLTGRVNIYSGIIQILENRFWTGYGYGSGYIVTSRNLGGYANAQNGLAQWFLQIGCIGTVLLIIFIWKYLNIIDSNKKVLCKFECIYIFLYVFVILASVEVTISKNFMGLIAIMYACSIYEKYIADSKTESVNGKKL